VRLRTGEAVVELAPEGWEHRLAGPASERQE
jgi:hypothetical protein